MATYAPQSVAERPYPWPVTISQSEYDRVWKPAGWRVIVIGPTSTWREEWGEWEAIRDIVQNCLDEAEKYYYGYDEDGLWIADTGKGVAVADFLLGPPKLKPDWARGKFGEGMKIASLALLRAGYPVYIETVKRELWIVFLEQETNGKVKTLAALWRPDGVRVGTKFHIIGYKGSAYEKNFAINLPRSLILAEVPSPVAQPKQRYNQLIRAEGMAAGAHGEGVIYIRDIYLRDITSPFSYNLWGCEIAPDRHGPKNEGEMWADAGRLWAGVTKVPLLYELIKMVTDPPLTSRTSESQHMSMDWMGTEPTTGMHYMDIMDKNALLWQQAWARAVGKNAVLHTDEGLNAMVVHLGYRSVSLIWGMRNSLARVIKTDRMLVREMAERLSHTQDIADSKQGAKQLAHLKLARAIAANFPKVGGVSAAIIPPASDMVERTAGTYEFDTRWIKINEPMLDNASDTVDVMVHELGHHVAYQRTDWKDKEAAGDLTRGHSDAMSYVASYISKILTEGRLDDYLKEVTW